MSRFTPTAACVLAVALLAAVAVATGTAHAQQPTPTSTERQTSRITIRFVSNGEPVTFSSLNFPSRVSADGVTCLLPIIEGGGTEYALNWPFLPIEGQPEECTKGPPTTIRVEFNDLFAEILWTGVDVTVDLEVPGAAATPTPSSPALPETGTSQSDGGSNIPVVVVSAFAVSAVVLLAATALLYFDKKLPRLRY